MRGWLIPILVLAAVAAAAGIWLALGGVDPVGRLLLARISGGGRGRWIVEVSRVGGNVVTRWELDSLRVAAHLPGGEEKELLRAEKLTVGWKPWSLFRGRLEVSELVLESPELSISPLIRLAGGRGEEEGEPGLLSSGEGGFPRLVVGRVAIDKGLLALREGGKPLTMVDVSGVLEPTGREGGWRLELAGGHLAHGASLLPLAELRLSGGATPERLVIDELRLRVGSSRVAGRLTLDRGVRGALSGELSLAPLAMADLASLAEAEYLPARGGIAGRIVLGGTRRRALLSGELGGTVGEVPLTHLSLSLAVEEGRLSVEEMRGRLGEGSISGRGHLSLAPQGDYRGEVVFSSVDPGPWLLALGRELGGAISGTVGWEGAGLAGGGREVSARATIGESRVGTARIDSMDIRAEASPRSGARATLRGSLTGDELEGNVSLSPDGSLAGSLEAHLLGGDLLNSLLARKDVSARGFLTGSIGGTRQTPRATLAGTMADLRLGPVHCDSAALALTATLPQDGQGISLAAALEAEGVRRGAARLELMRRRLGGRGERTEVHDVELRRGPLWIRGDAEVTRRGEEQQVVLRHLELQTGELRWRPTGPVRLLVGVDGYELVPVRLEAGEAILAASVRSRNDSLQASVEVEGFEVRNMGELESLGGPIAGRVDLALRVSGRRASPSGEAELTIEGGSVRGFLFRHLGLGLSLVDGRLRVEEGTIETAGGRAKLTGCVPLLREPARAGTLTVKVEDMRISSLRSLWPRLERVEGRADVVLTLGGMPQSPWLEIEAAGSEVYAAAYELGDLRLSARWADSVLTINELQVTGPSGQGRLAGYLPLIPDTDRLRMRLTGRPLEMEVQVRDGDLALFSLLSEAVREAAGRFDAHVLISGPVNRPQGVGQVTVRDGELSFSWLAEPFREVKGSIELAGDRLVMDSLRARQGKEGQVALAGYVLLDGRRVSGYRLGLSVRDYEPWFWREVEGRADGELTLTPHELSSGTRVPHLEGEVEVDELVVRRDFRRRAAAGAEGREETALPLPPTLTYELAVQGDNNLRVENRDVIMELEGKVLALRDEDGLRLLGELRTIRGRYHLYNNTFDIRRGTFTFGDVSDLGNVGLDVLAETNVGGEKIQVTVSGSLRDPQIETISESGWNDTYIFRTLTLGAQAGEEEGEGGFTSGLIDSWRQALLDRWGSQVARELGVDDIRLRRDPRGEEATRLEVGKRIWSDVYLNLQYAVGEPRRERQLTDWELRSPERMLSLEYRLSDRFTVDGEAGTLEGVEFLNVDLKFKWSY